MLYYFHKNDLTFTIDICNIIKIYIYMYFGVVVDCFLLKMSAVS